MRYRLSTLFFAAALSLTAPTTTLAQQQDASARPAVLVANDLFITRDRVLVAKGKVEAFQGDMRLQATEIRYDQRSGALQIKGPIVLSEGTKTVILADAAQLDADLRNGLLRGARMVLEQRLQMAAVQINRVEGRYTQLYKTAVTSCRVCNDGRPPLWQIRARRVIHDQQEKQLYFEDAQLRVGNMPIFYLPRMRLPDPTLERATGFLIPSLRTTSQLGTGLRLPYFIKMGDHRDLTLTPYFSSATRTLELRYRQAFVRGRITFNGAVTRDDERPDATRAYLFGVGDFDLNRDYKLHFALEMVSDRSYLKDYGYSGKDRLASEINVSRTRRDKYVRVGLINFESLRDGEVNDTLPTLVLDGVYEKRFFPASIGGELRFGVDIHTHGRASKLDIDGPDPDLIVDGRDVARINASVDWLRRMPLANGMVTDLRTGASVNAFVIGQDAAYDEFHAEITPHASVSLRYPMQRRGKDGSTQILEPVAQLGWVHGNRLVIPNEESTRAEFDQGNLLSLSHFPRPDRRERGVVAALGLSWTRLDPKGWDANITVGQVLRETSDPAFSISSGLSGSTSDFLLAGQLKTANGLALTGRTLFNDTVDISKAELRGDWRFTKGRLGGSYVWLGADLQEDRLKDVSEITLDGDYKINQYWKASADWRFDMADDRAATAGLGLSYNNECVSVDLSVRRRYSTSTSVEPSTDFGFNIGLRGFSAATGTESYSRSCKY